jgi:hypothetical protein
MTVQAFRLTIEQIIAAVFLRAQFGPAGKKSVELGRKRGRYGDLAPGFGLMRLDRSGCCDRFVAKQG